MYFFSDRTVVTYFHETMQFSGRGRAYRPCHQSSLLQVRASRLRLQSYGRVIRWTHDTTSSSHNTNNPPLSVRTKHNDLYIGNPQELMERLQNRCMSTDPASTLEALASVLEGKKVLPSAGREFPSTEITTEFFCPFLQRSSFTVVHTEEP